MPIHDGSRIDAGIFHDIHLGWIDGLRAALNRTLLPEPYYALAEPVLGSNVPDVLTLRSQGLPGASAGVPEGLHDDTAERPVAEAVAVVQDLPPVDVYLSLARHVVIRSSLRDDDVVAVIEIVSRANKRSREERDRFVAKAVDVLQGGVHLLFVDVQPPATSVLEELHSLICGARGETPAPLPGDRRLQCASYQVLEDGTARAHVVPLRVGDTLPEMPVFLTAHHYVRVPLEETYARAFGNLPRRFRELLEA